jgi:hypothetical protein
MGSKPCRRVGGEAEWASVDANWSRCRRRWCWQRSFRCRPPCNTRSRCRCRCVCVCGGGVQPWSGRAATCCADVLCSDSADSTPSARSRSRCLQTLLPGFLVVADGARAAALRLHASTAPAKPFCCACWWWRWRWCWWCACAVRGCPGAAVPGAREKKKNV